MSICCLGKSGKVKITKVAFLTETGGHATTEIYLAGREKKRSVRMLAYTFTVSGNV